MIEGAPSTRGLCLLVAALCMGVLAKAGAAATEDEFVYVDRMPAAQGELRDEISGEVGGLEIILSKRVFTLETDAWVVATHVMSARCPGSAMQPAAEPYVVAVQYLPRRPSSMAMAGLHDVYKEVYVTDPDGRIRLYEEMDGREMVELTSRFRPSCERV